jgi:N,N'-diacetyllegionaminate synthase
MKTLIIAEAGVNHNGDIDIAKKLIGVAAAAGADFVKFQSFLTEKSISKEAPKADYQVVATGSNISQYDMVKKLELSREDHAILIEECRRCGISFLSTAFDSDSLGMLIDFGISHIKVPSGDITNLPLVRYMASFGKPIILSTGMATLGDVESAIDLIVSSGTPRSLITVLHCTTEYPAPMEEVNLRAMTAMKYAFDVDVGYSDHTRGIEISIAAVALGAKVIEKHFTLSRTMEGPDHKASLEPDELSLLISSIRNLEKALGDGVKKVSHSEKKNILVARKSLVAIKEISAGELFDADNIGVKRPGNGISPMFWDEVLGRPARRAFKVDEQIEL